MTPAEGNAAFYNTGITNLQSLLYTERILRAVKICSSYLVAIPRAHPGAGFALVQYPMELTECG